jgi:DNA-binding CsgD family transcriptional regulator
MLSLLLLIPIAVIAYKYVGNSISGIFFGLATAVTKEILVAIVYGFTPFYAFLNFEYFRYADVLLPYIISYAGFPIVGFIGGKISQKRGIVKLPYSGSYELTELEKQVLSYIKTNHNRIHIVECAVALNVEPSLVKTAIKSLQRKGEIET